VSSLKEDAGVIARVASKVVSPSSVIGLVSTMRDDVDSAFRNDPAARNRMEVVLAYPGLHAIWCHRLANALWRSGLVILPRLMSHAARFLTGIEIHPGATLGSGVFIDHGMGVVIGETATVGDGCLLYQGVVLGGVSLERKKRHPDLGRNVVVGAGACILGPLQLGDNSRVGAGSVVVRDVPSGATVVGIPAKIVATEDGPVPHSRLDHANLPDPLVQALKGLQERADSVESRLDRLERPAAPLRAVRPAPKARPRAVSR